MQAFHYLLRQIVTFVLLLTLPTALLGYLTLSRAPLVLQTSTLDAETLAHGRELMNRLHASFAIVDARLVDIETTPQELNAAFALAARTLPGFQGHASLNEQGVFVQLSLPFRTLGMVRYANATLQIQAGQGPLQLGSIQLGEIRLPGRVALAILQQVADQAWGEGQGAQMLSRIRGIQVQQDMLRVQLEKPAGFGLSALKQKGLTAYRQLFGGNKQRESLEWYYQQLLGFAKERPQGSLVPYLQYAITLAAERSGGDATKAADENRLALYGLAQLLGGPHLQMLVNEVKNHDELTSMKVTLARRRDLQQHFIYSATVHLLTSQHISDAVGETKELLDSLQGGSGFSFVDLLADRAGVRFAKLVTAPETALAVQQFFTGPERLEAEVFPSKSRLPEGMPKALFEQRFQSIESDEYKQMVAEIDRRLQALPLFQLENIATDHR